MTTWKTRIDDLRTRGMTLSEIGEQVGLSTGAVSDIANGHTQSLRGEAALKLDALHRRAMRRVRPENTAA